MGFSLFGSSSNRSSESASFWTDLSSLAQLDSVIALSETSPQLIFKHSTRCIISRTVLKNFEADWDASAIKGQVYLLDLLNHRDISNAIAELLGVHHESPQLILIENKKVSIHRSHQGISAVEILKTLS